MYIAVICLFVGLILLVAGYVYGHNDAIIGGIWILPGLVITLISIIAMAFCLKWWFGVLIIVTTISLFIGLCLDM